LLPEFQRLLNAEIGLLDQLFQGFAAHTASKSSIEWLVVLRVVLGMIRVLAPAFAAFHRAEIDWGELQLVDSVDMILEPDERSVRYSVARFFGSP
jgi:hypothetical protein